MLVVAAPDQQPYSLPSSCTRKIKCSFQADPRIPNEPSIQFLILDVTVSRFFLDRVVGTGLFSFIHVLLVVLLV